MKEATAMAKDADRLPDNQPAPVMQEPNERRPAMKRVLVAYCTNAGSTADVAAAVGEELENGGAQVDVRQLGDVGELHDYTAVVVGGPMILGWHRELIAFLTKHQRCLSQLPVAYFITALRLTQTPATEVDSVPIYLDSSLVRPPQRADRLNFKERYATVDHYLAPVLHKAPLVRPISVGFFAGKLDYGTLPLPARLFVQFIIGAKPGDYRNWPAIRAWAAEIRLLLLADEAAYRLGARDLEAVVAEAATV
jgi:menaquinone-dependent protoporphyrinogen oxidase